MIKRIAFVVLPVLLCSGCLQVSYTGQEFAKETPPRVEFFDQNSDVSACYTRVGYAELSAPGAYSVSELRQELITKAESVGANAVGIVSYKKILVGEYVQSNNMTSGPTGNWTVMSTTGDGSNVYTDSFGAEQRLNENMVKRYEIHIRADFYVFRARYDVRNPEAQLEQPGSLTDQVINANTKEQSLESTQL